MTYNGDKKWADVASAATVAADNMREALIHGLEAFEEYISLKGAMTDAQLAAQLETDEANVQAAAACFQALLELYNFADNVASPTQGDRFFSLRKFT